MNLIFPTQSPFPLYPTLAPEADDAAMAAFFDALRNFFRSLMQQHASTRRYFDAAGFYCNDANRDSSVRTQSQDVAQEAISAVIKNIVPPTRREYVWDPNQQRWVLQTIPISV